MQFVGWVIMGELSNGTDTESEVVSYIHVSGSYPNQTTCPWIIVICFLLQQIRTRCLFSAEIQTKVCYTEFPMLSSRSLQIQNLDGIKMTFSLALVRVPNIRLIRNKLMVV